MYREVWEGCVTRAACEFARVTGCGNAPSKIKNIMVGRQSSRAWHRSHTKCHSITAEKQGDYSALNFL